jgi:hypothetical protein
MSSIYVEEEAAQWAVPEVEEPFQTLKVESYDMVEMVLLAIFFVSFFRDIYSYCIKKPRMREKAL